MSLSEVCRRANVSRQTLYSLELVPHRLPSLQTIVALSSVLAVHPFRLLQLIFDELPMQQQLKQRHRHNDKSAFIQENIPDGTLVLFNQRFIKTWELQNVGRIPWENRFLQCMDEQIVVYTHTKEKKGAELEIVARLLPVTTRIVVPHTKPGAIVKLSVEFTAPAMPCNCISYWKSVFEDGSLCFPKSQGLSVMVRVSSVGTGSFSKMEGE